MLLGTQDEDTLLGSIKRIYREKTYEFQKETFLSSSTQNIRYKNKKKKRKTIINKNMICTESFCISSKLKHIMLNIMLNSSKKAWSHSTTIHNIGQQSPKKNSSTKRSSDRNSKNIPKTERWIPVYGAYLCAKMKSLSRSCYPNRTLIQKLSILKCWLWPQYQSDRNRHKKKLDSKEL